MGVGERQPAPERGTDVRCPLRCQPAAGALGTRQRHPLAVLAARHSLPDPTGEGLGAGFIPGLVLLGAREASRGQGPLCWALSCAQILMGGLRSDTHEWTQGAEESRRWTRVWTLVTCRASWVDTGAEGYRFGRGP